MRDAPSTLKHRLLAYGTAAGAASTLASADIVVVEDASIPIDWGTNTATLSHQCLELDLNFVRSTFDFQTGYAGPASCCEYGTEPIETVWGGVSYCVEWSGYLYGMRSFRSECEVACGANAVAAFIGDEGDHIDPDTIGCSSETTVCSSFRSDWSSCAGSGGTKFDNCDERRRFYVGFQSDILGSPVFGWIQVDTAGPTGLQITKWAYEDSGLEIKLGDEPTPEPPTCSPDLNGDGVVNAADMGILLGNWGPCDP